MTSGQVIRYPIGRDTQHRTRMKAFTEEVGNVKAATTHIRVRKKFPAYTLIEASLETGRTHQIRVHLAKVGHPIVGDRIYGRLRFPKGASIAWRTTLAAWPRQALHAGRLTLTHPLTHQCMTWQVDLPEDMQHLLTVLSDG